MGPQDWFALAVRVVGLMTLITGLATLLDGFLLKLGYFTHIESSPAYYLIFGVANLVGGFCLILGAPVVADLHIREKTRTRVKEMRIRTEWIL
jgi:hypothetical protein